MLAEKGTEPVSPDLPPVVANGLFTLGAAALTGLIGMITGKHKGRIEGEEKVHADYINAIQGAASHVIEELRDLVSRSEAREAECVTELGAVKDKQAAYEAQQSALRAQIEALMSGPVATYNGGGAR